MYACVRVTVCNDFWMGRQTVPSMKLVCSSSQTPMTGIRHITAHYIVVLLYRMNTVLQKRPTRVSKETYIVVSYEYCPVLLLFLSQTPIAGMRYVTFYVHMRRRIHVYVIWGGGYTSKYALCDILILFCIILILLLCDILILFCIIRNALCYSVILLYIILSMYFFLFYISASTQTQVCAMTGLSVSVSVCVCVCVCVCAMTGLCEPIHPHTHTHTHTHTHPA